MKRLGLDRNKEERKRERVRRGERERREKQ